MGRFRETAAKRGNADFKNIFTPLIYAQGESQLNLEATPRL
jgi:hypothetical protein